MKHIVIVLSLVLSSWKGLAGPGEGINFFHGTWKEALQKAQQEKKNLFVDFYTDWCGPCKLMSKEVFVDAEVGAYFNGNFIAVKVNAEKEEAELVAQLSVNAYPTLAVFDPAGAVLVRTEGALKVDEFLKFVKSVNEFSQVEEEYRKDPRNIQKFNAYAQLLSYKGTDKISGEVTKFLDGIPMDGLKTEAAWTLIVDRFDDYKSETFKKLCKEAKWFKENREDFEKTYAWFTNFMLAKAAEAQDLSLVEELKKDYITIRKSVGTLRQNEDYYEAAIDLAYKKLVNDTTWGSGLLDMVTQYHGSNWRILDANVLDILQSGNATADDLKLCLVLAQKAHSMKKNSFTYYVLAAAYEANGDDVGNKEKAKTNLLHALKLATTDQLSMNGGGYTTVVYEEAGEALANLVEKLL